MGRWASLGASSLLVAVVTAGCSLLLATGPSSPQQDASEAGGDADVSSGDADIDADGDDDDDLDETCLPDCDDKVCGDDGCGGTCGVCEDGVCCDGLCLPAGACCSAGDCGCTGQPTSCRRLSGARCGEVEGCSPATICMSPVVSSCDTFIHSYEACQACNCSWVSDSCAEPGGTRCDGIAPGSCDLCGCTVGSCDGDAAPCERHTAEDSCTGQPGCEWQRCIDHVCVTP